MKRSKSIAFWLALLIVFCINLPTIWPVVAQNLQKIVVSELDVSTSTPASNPDANLLQIYSNSGGDVISRSHAGTVKTILDSSKSTSNLTEGSNLYFTNARATAAFNSGQAIITFSGYDSTSTTTITGQTNISTTSIILLTVYADSDDALAHEWIAKVGNVINGTGFDIIVAPLDGTYSGTVKVNWMWK